MFVLVAGRLSYKYHMGVNTDQRMTKQKKLLTKMDTLYDFQ